VLKAEGFTASAAPNLDEAKAALARQTPDVVLLDLNLPDGSGMTLLDGIEGLRAPAVVLITGHASVSTVVEALRRGVTDYLTKPVDVDRLRTILGNIAHTRQLPEEIKSLQTERDQSGKFGLLVGRSANMRRTFELIGRIAPSSASVLISGESGTGKDVVARTLHSLSRRRHGPFVPVNCGAIRRRCSKASCSGTNAAASPAPIGATAATSNARIAARCSSTRSPRCRSNCR
jgi:DNA-binding NtrC family response regulator